MYRKVANTGGPCLVRFHLVQSLKAAFFETGGALMTWALRYSRVRLNIIFKLFHLNEVHSVLGLCDFFFGLWKNPQKSNLKHLHRSVVTKKAWVKEFLHLCSENHISWIYGPFFENAHKWKPHHWNLQEPRTPCTISGNLHKRCLVFG